MNIQAEKLEIIKMVLEMEDTVLLESIKELMQKESKPDFYSTLPPDQEEDIMPEFETDEPEDFDEFIKKYGM